MTVPTVLVVCLGNICRSPAAEAALKEAASDASLELNVVSAGTGSWHVGDPPNPRMRAAAARVGLELDGEAAQAEPAGLEAADLVLAMDRSNLQDLQQLATEAGVTTPIRLFREFDPQPGDLEVPDPYYGGDEGFVEVVDIVRRTASEVVRRIADGELIGPAAGDDDSTKA